MNREDVIRMAREAGLLPLLDEDCFQAMGAKNFDTTKKVLERFADLVAAAEREECAKVCDELDLGMFAYEAAAAIRARSQS